MKYFTSLFDTGIYQLTSLSFLFLEIFEDFAYFLVIQAVPTGVLG